RSRREGPVLGTHRGVAREDRAHQGTGDQETPLVLGKPEARLPGALLPADVSAPEIDPAAVGGEVHRAPRGEARPPGARPAPFLSTARRGPLHTGPRSGRWRTRRRSPPRAEAAHRRPGPDKSGPSADNTRS